MVQGQQSRILPLCFLLRKQKYFLFDKLHCLHSTVNIGCKMKYDDMFHSQKLGTIQVYRQYRHTTNDSIKRANSNDLGDNPTLSLLRWRMAILACEHHSCWIIIYNTLVISIKWSPKHFAPSTNHKKAILGCQRKGLRLEKTDLGNQVSDVTTAPHCLRPVWI